MSNAPENNAFVAPSGPYSIMLRNTVSDYRGATEPRLPVSEVSAVQLKPGPPPSNVSVFSSRPVSLLGVNFHAPSVGTVILRPEQLGFMWWNGGDECRINGERARRDTLHMAGAQGGFHATGGARQTMGMTLRRRDWIRTLAALEGVDPDEIRCPGGRLHLAPARADRLRHGIHRILNRAASPAARYGRAFDPGEQIFGLFVDTWLAGRSEERRDRRLKPELIVRRAEERFFAAQDARVSLADLCAAAHVSQATLYRAFHAVCGEPPLAYFHKRRLNAARRNLLRSAPIRGAVKRAALAAGLTELGRFAVEYRLLFGESPSATLQHGDGEPS